MKIKDLKVSGYNPRIITDKKLEMLGKSMQKFGDLSGVIFNKRTGRLIGGHQRIKHLKPDWKIIKKPHKDKLGTVAEGYIETPYGRWVYREVNWPEIKEIMANIAANQHGGEFDLPKLKDLIVKVDDGSKDIELIGFEKNELEELFESNGEGKKGLIDDDAVPERPKKAKTKLGDLYLMGTHRLLCGDSTQKGDVLYLMDGKKADMVFTDPPYGIDLDTDFTSMVGIGRGKKYKKIIGDNHNYNSNHIFKNFNYCKEIFLWGADYYYDSIPNLKNGSWFVWDKTEGGVSPNSSYDKMFGSNFELCWSRNKHKRAIARILWKGIFGLNKEDTKKRIHPTQKPVELSLWFFKKFSNQNNLIADLFLGSGSTLIACEKMDRICYGMEIDPLYCDVIVKRWEDFTGKKTKLVRHGK